MKEVPVLLLTLALTGGRKCSQGEGGGGKGEEESSLGDFVLVADMRLGSYSSLQTRLQALSSSSLSDSV